MEGLGHVTLRMFAAGSDSAALAHLSMARGSSGYGYEGADSVALLLAIVLLGLGAGVAACAVIHFVRARSEPSSPPRHHLLGSW